MTPLTLQNLLDVNVQKSYSIYGERAREDPFFDLHSGDFICRTEMESEVFSFLGPDDTFGQFSVITAEKTGRFHDLSDTYQVNYRLLVTDKGQNFSGAEEIYFAKVIYRPGKPVNVVALTNAADKPNTPIFATDSYEETFAHWLFDQCKLNCDYCAMHESIIGHFVKIVVQNRLNVFERAMLGSDLTELLPTGMTDKAVEHALADLPRDIPDYCEKEVAAEWYKTYMKTRFPGVDCELESGFVEWWRVKYLPIIDYTDTTVNAASWIYNRRSKPHILTASFALLAYLFNGVVALSPGITGNLAGEYYVSALCSLIGRRRKKWRLRGLTV